MITVMMTKRNFFYEGAAKYDIDLHYTAYIKYRLRKKSASKKTGLNQPNTNLPHPRHTASGKSSPESSEGQEGGLSYLNTSGCRWYYENRRFGEYYLF